MNEFDASLVPATIPGVIIAVGYGVSLVVAAVRQRRRKDDDKAAEPKSQRAAGLLGQVYRTFLGYAARSPEPLTDDERALLRDVSDFLRR